MKKFFISLILIFLAHFFTINQAYCEEDFFIDSSFEDAKSQNKITKEKIVKSLGEKKEKKSFFKRKKQKENDESKGYYGKLPDIEGDFEYKKQNISKTPQIDMKIPTEDELNEENLKKAPFDDSLFLDMVLKKEPDSQYLNDVQKIKFALKNLKNCIEEKGDIQRFNACVNHLELYVQNLKKKYENKSEALRESYIELLNTNYYAKILGNLKYDANYYSHYVPVQQGQYSKENISSQEQKLLERVNKTLFLLNNEV